MTFTLMEKHKVHYEMASMVILTNKIIGLLKIREQHIREFLMEDLMITIIGTLIFGNEVVTISDLRILT